MNKPTTLNFFRSSCLLVTNLLCREKQSREGRRITWLVPKHLTIAQFHLVLDKENKIALLMVLALLSI